MKFNIAGRRVEVTPTFLDRAISYVSPQAGVKRLRARATLPLYGGYKGGSRDRRGTRNWRPFEGSANADVLPDLPDLRSRSRDLARNAPIATGAINTTVANVIGEGLRLQSAIDYETLGLTEDQADAWERAAEREWRLWCKRADFSGVQSFGELQALAFRSMLESGDCFAVRRYRQDAGGTYGTKVQLLEADRISNPNRGADSEKIAGGVEVDGDGVPVAYHISDRHPGNLRSLQLNWARVAAQTEEGKQVVLHLFDRIRPEQTRGIPFLAPVIEHLKALSDYSDAEVRAALVSAMYTVFVETPADETPNPVSGETGSGALDENEVGLGSGAVVSLSPGEKISTASPGRPNDKFDPFVQAILRQVGVALELPFELLIKHFTASYSASRAALEMAWQGFRRRRAWCAERFNQPIYEWVIEEAVATGRLAAPGFFEDPLVAKAYCQALWIGSGRPSIDQTKDAEADKAYLEMEIITREEIRAERFGDRGDWEAVHKQATKEAELRRRDGTDTPSPTQSKNPPPPEPDADDETQMSRLSA